jgi:hypothetical protein
MLGTDAGESRERELLACCVHLRTKTQHGRPDEMQAGPGRIKVSTTGAYWCTRTSTPFGPDDAPSRPETCQPGRPCFRPG